MAKRQETLDIETALEQMCREKRDIWLQRSYNWISTSENGKRNL